MLAEPAPGIGDLTLGVRARTPPADVDLLALEVLVDREELLDLLAQQHRQVLELFVPVPVRIVQGNADDLVIDALLVAHLEHPHGLDRDQTPRERRLVQADECVEGIAVLAQRATQVAVVGRIRGGTHQQPVELDATELRVVLVLVAAALGDLHDADQVHSLTVLGLCAHATDGTGEASGAHDGFSRPREGMDLS